jgi:hypothetical protein
MNLSILLNRFGIFKNIKISLAFALLMTLVSGLMAATFSTDE